MSIDIPTETLRELVQHPQDLQREVILAMYEAREIASGKARELLGLSVLEWDGLRKERRLRGAYDLPELEKDVATLQKTRTLVIVVSDTSPLSYLSKIGRLDFLPQLFGEVALPPAVLMEWERDVTSQDAREIARIDGWLRIVAPTDERAVADLERWIDRGEAEAIVLAQELHADLLLVDDEDGRKAASERGLAISGVLGVLLRAKRANLIPALRPDLERLLKETSFFCSDSLLQNVLTLAGE